MTTLDRFRELTSPNGLVQNKAARLDLAGKSKKLNLFPDGPTPEDMAKFNLLNPGATDTDRLNFSASIQSQNIERQNLQVTAGDVVRDSLVGIADTAQSLILNTAGSTINKFSTPDSTLGEDLDTIKNTGRQLGQSVADLTGNANEFRETFSPETEPETVAELPPEDEDNLFRINAISLSEQTKGSFELSKVASKGLFKAADSISEYLKQFKSSNGKRVTEATTKANEAFEKARMAQLPENPTSEDIQEATLDVVNNWKNNLQGKGTIVKAVESLPFLLAAGKASSLGAKASKNLATKREVAKGVPNPKAIAKAEAKGSVVGSTLAVGALEGASTEADVFNKVLKADFETLAANSTEFNSLVSEGKTQEEAREIIARKESRKAGKSQSLFAALSNIATGGIAEKALSKVGSSNAIAATVKSAVTEAPEEAVQSASGAVAGNLADKATVDKNKDIGQGVVTAAVEGAVIGAVSAGATVGATKGLGSTVKATGKALKATGSALNKASSAIEARKATLSAEAEASKTPDTAEATHAQVKASPEAKVDELLALDDNTFITNISSVTAARTALLEKFHSEDTPEADKPAILKRGLALKERILKTTAEAQKTFEASTEAVKSEPDTASVKDTQQAFVAATDPTNTDTELKQKLSGSKHLTTNQKALLSELRKPASPLNTAGKADFEVHADVVKGSEGFTGITDYIELVNTAIQAKDSEGALFSLRKLKNLQRIQNTKVKTGRFPGKGQGKIPANTLALIVDEANAANIAHNALQDSISKAFPKVAEVLKRTETSGTAQVQDALKRAPSVNVVTEPTTVPRTQRERLLREALTSLPKVPSSSANFGKLRKAFSELGGGTRVLTQLTDSFSTIDTISKIPAEERTKEQRAELNQSRRVLNDTYLSLIDSVGQEDLISILQEHGNAEAVQSILTTLPEPVSLDTSAIPTTFAHTPVTTKTSELTGSEFSEFEDLRLSVKDFVEANPAVLDDDSIASTYNVVANAELGLFSDNTQDIYNQAAGLINTLEIPNSEVSAANSETKAKATTPFNRTFQNVVEAAPAKGFLRNFEAVNSTLGLLQVEENLVSKLADTGSDIYTHLTRNLSPTDKTDLHQYNEFLRKFEGKLNRTLKGRKTGTTTNAKGTVLTHSVNDYLDEFIVDGKFKPAVAAAIGSGFANWATVNASKTLFTDDAGIAKLLGKDPGYVPTKVERVLHGAGMSMNYVAQQIGKDVVRTMGLKARTDANENFQKQLVTNLGMAAIAASLDTGSGSKGILKRQYAHINSFASKTLSVHLTDSHVKPKAAQGEVQTIPVLTVVPNSSQPDENTTRLNTNVEQAIQGISNPTVMRDIYGIESAMILPILDGQSMRKHSVEDGIAPKQVEALNRSQEIEYVPDMGMWDLIQQLDPDYRNALVDGIPPAGTEHVNNTARNDALRENIAKDFENVQTMLDLMQESGSETLRFPAQASKRNLRMIQQGTLGTPQGNKLVRHLFKMKDNAIDVPLDDTALRASYKLAVMEALDEDSTEGRGVDKSTDESVVAAFEALLESGKYARAIEGIRAESKSREDIIAIQEAIGLPSVKRAAGTTGTAIKLDGLFALSQYEAESDFKVNLFKENDGIANGIAIGLMQFAGATSFEDYKLRLAQVGIFVEDPTMRSFGDFANTGKADVYVTFGSEVAKQLNDPHTYPATEENILPEVSTTGTSIVDFPIVAHQSKTVLVTDAAGNTEELSRYFRDAGKPVVRNSKEEHASMAGALNYFMGKGFRDKETGTFKEVLNYVDVLIRDFSKSPLMLAGYGAAIKGLKVAMVNNVLSSITLALEDLNQLEGEARVSAIASLELAVNNLSTQKPQKGKYVFKVAENPLETVVDTDVSQLISYGVESTMGPALESTFQRMYGVQRHSVDKVIQGTRIATAVYSKVLDSLRKEKMKELDRDYLTNEESKEIVDSLREHSPLVATAISDDRLNEGIWLPKGEASKDTKEGAYINEGTDKVKVALAFGSNKSAEAHTYSDKILDPGVSAGAVLTQSIDASTQVTNMAQATLTNVHDALIVNLKDSGSITTDHNKGFFDVVTGYSMLESVNDMLDSVLEHEAVTPAILSEVTKELKFALAKHDSFTIRDFMDNSRKEVARIKNNKELVTKHSEVLVNQYSAGHESGIQMIPEDALTTSEKNAQWADPTESEVLAGSSGSFETQSKEDLIDEYEIDKANVRGIFEGLKGQGAVTASRAHTEQLARIVDIIEPIIKKVNVKVFAVNEEASGAVVDSGIQMTINTSAKVNAIEMSSQEILVHELTHTLFHMADKGSREYKEITKMYNEARRELRPSDFLAGINNPTKEDKRAAKARYEHTVFNSVAGGQAYKTFLGESKQLFNADAVEEFAVMALTNEHLRNALSNMSLRTKTEPEGFFGKLAALVERFLNAIGLGLDDGTLAADERIVRLTELLQGSLNQKKSLLYRAASIADRPLDAISSRVHEFIDDHTQKYRDIHETLKPLQTYQDALKWAGGLRAAALETSIAKNSFANSLYNEFTSGRKSLDALAKLVTKSSQTIERMSEFFKETVSKELNDIFDGVTEPERAQLYRLLETDTQHLLGNYDVETIKGLLTKDLLRKKEIAKLKIQLKQTAPTAYQYLLAHTKDLGYHQVTGERLIVDGQYINAFQVANLWGYSGKYPKFSTKNAEKIIDQLASLYAIEFTHQDAEMNELFNKKFDTNALEALLNLQAETVKAGLETTFKDNEYNMRKGYVKEDFANQVDIVVGTVEDHDRLIALGYQLGTSATGDPLVQNEGKSFYIKENGEMAKYLTGALSTATPTKRGTDLFQVSASDNEVTRLQVDMERDELFAKKQQASKNTFKGKAAFVRGANRKNIAQPLFNSQGEVYGYRYVASHNTKNTIHGRKLDFAQGLAGTLANVSRRVQTKRINGELMEYFHQQYTDNFDSTPGLFVNVARDPQYKDQYLLIPDEAKARAAELFGSSDLWIPRTQIDIALGYRKFSVSQLKYDKDPKATALREVLRLANNAASVAFNNQVGISVEAFWQGFVATAKDTLVIKSGFVTAANIASNLALLWMSGVNPVQATKDHAVAYPATEKYLRDQEREFKIGLELKRPNITKQQAKELESERSVLRQDLFNNPVRELMEAGMYSAIVDDVEVGENVTVAKDWLDKKLEPYVSKAPDALVSIGKNFLLTHDTKAYKVMRGLAQTSDFAARYSLHKHNLAQGMSLDDSISDIRTTFVDYDIPSHKSIQYANDMGLLGFTKYFFRIQQVIVKRFAEKPARLLSFALFNNMLGLGISTPTDALFGFDALTNRMYGPDDWADFATMSAPMNLLIQ